jgi:glycosyltransferase involved in cell wall biosynthesis
VVYDTGNIEMGVMETLGKGKVVRAIVAMLEAAFIRESDVILVRGVSFADFLGAHFHRSTEVYYVPDPVDVLAYDAEPSRETVRAIGRGTGDQLRVAYASTFDTIQIGGAPRPRGWEVIEAVANSTFDLHDKVNIRFIGSGPAIASLRDLAVAKGMERNCAFTGFLPDREYALELCSADIGFMEDYDTLGYRFSVGAKIQNYMAAGLAVITGNTPEKTHLLRTQRIAQFLIPPCSVTAEQGIQRYVGDLATALVFASDHPEEVKLAGMRNRLAALNDFDVGRVQSDLIRVYRILLPPGEEGI